MLGIGLLWLRQLLLLLVGVVFWVVDGKVALLFHKADVVGKSLSVGSLSIVKQTCVRELGVLRGAWSRSRGTTGILIPECTDQISGLAIVPQVRVRAVDVVRLSQGLDRRRGITEALELGTARRGGAGGGLLAARGRDRVKKGRRFAHLSISTEGRRVREGRHGRRGLVGSLICVDVCRHGAGGAHAHVEGARLKSVHGTTCAVRSLKQENQ